MTESQSPPPQTVEEALGDIPASPSLALPRWLAPLVVCCVLALVPWIGYLARTLPRRAAADNYDLAWISFDVGMAVVLAALAICAVRRLTATGPIAAVAATLLCVDAWFDVVTTDDRGAFAVSVLMAVFAELPLALVCAWVAINAERVRRRAYQRLLRRWQHAVNLAREVDGRAAHGNTPAADDADRTLRP